MDLRKCSHGVPHEMGSCKQCQDVAELTARLAAVEQEKAAVEKERDDLRAESDILRASIEVCRKNEADLRERNRQLELLQESHVLESKRIDEEWQQLAAQLEREKGERAEAQRQRDLFEGHWDIEKANLAAALEEMERLKRGSDIFS